jgi:aminomethyltransferase
MSNIMKHTPLYGLHREAQAQLVSFAGYELPLQYPEGMFEEHLHTRKAVSLFDISHMAQIEISGPRVQQELERLIPLDLDQLSLSHQAYTVLTNEQGGVIDDLIITRRNRDNFVLIVNAACKDKVIQHLSRELQDSPIHILNDHALLALQGPRAVTVLLQHFPSEVGHLAFLEGMLVKFQGVECFVSRSGYTGEDGFEISIPAQQVEKLARELLRHGDVKWAGLGARNSLRLEAGLCCYGHELAETISPVVAGLAWSFSKSRCEEGKKSGNFMGSDIILHQLKTGTIEKRVGLVVQGNIAVNEGACLQDLQGNEAGEVTSATLSPSLGVNLAMAYVDERYARPGMELFSVVEEKIITLVVTRLPFVAHHYSREKHLLD